MKLRFLFSILCLFGISVGYSQMQATFDTQENTICDGSDCDYEGPSILINEMMMSPSTGDGSLSGGQSSQRGEWIELYNPNICEPIDISCYFLGSYVDDAPLFGNPQTGSEAYLLPEGTVVPPGGFCVVRGVNADAVNPDLLVENGGNTIEIVLPPTVTQDDFICVQGASGSGGIGGINTARLWFPNAGGWFAFYDENGVPQDAVKWGNGSGTNHNVECIPTRPGCSNTITSLDSYNNFPSDRKQDVYSTIPDSWGRSIRRMPDGGDWVVNEGESNFTLGDCNDECAEQGSSTCDGKATVNVTGGTAPYSYLWDDNEAQTTQTATGLCGEVYHVTVTDADGNQEVFEVDITNHIPEVTFNMNEKVCNLGQTIELYGYDPIPSSNQSGTFLGFGVNGTDFDVAVAGEGEHIISYYFIDEHGCENDTLVDTTMIIVHPNPEAIIDGLEDEYCLSNDILEPILSPTGGVLSGPGATSENTIDIMDAGLGTHTYTYTVENEFGCEDATSVQITIKGVEPPEFSVPDEICLHADPIVLSATPAGGEFSVNGETITEFDPEEFGEGQHTITYVVEDEGDCPAIAQDEITVNNEVDFTANIPDFFCYDSENYTVNIQPSGGDLIGDLVNGNEIDFSDASSGSHTITYEYTTEEGCSGTYEHTFTVGQELEIDFTVSQDCFQNVTLKAKSQSGSFSSYKWSEDGSNIGSGSSITTEVENHGDHVYGIVATDGSGCTAQHAATVYVEKGLTPNEFEIPNVITPNGDNINDEIEMPLMDDDCVDYKVHILNRWGNNVFTASKDEPVFKGKTQGGTDLNDGVYFYTIETKSFNCKESPFKKICTGHITVVRN